MLWIVWGNIKTSVICHWKIHIRKIKTSLKTASNVRWEKNSNYWSQKHFLPKWNSRDTWTGHQPSPCAGGAPTDWGPNLQKTFSTYLNLLDQCPAVNRYSLRFKTRQDRTLRRQAICTSEWQFWGKPTVLPTWQYSTTHLVNKTLLWSTRAVCGGTAGTSKWHQGTRMGNLRSGFVRGHNGRCESCAEPSAVTLQQPERSSSGKHQPLSPCWGQTAYQGPCQGQARFAGESTAVKKTLPQLVQKSE